MVFDPCIGQFDYIQEQVPAVPFVNKYNEFFNFNETFLSELNELHQSCGYQNYLDEYFVFPPKGVQPTKRFNYTSDAHCDVFDMAYIAALTPNPCFDIYEINLMCPILWSVLSFPTSLVYTPDGASTYFNRTDVKDALHAPHIEWTECSHDPVFTGGDKGPEHEGDISANPIENVLPQVIEATNRVLVSNGEYDMIILTNGTLLAIQNMTFNGQLGFQEQPHKPINIDLPDLQWKEVFEKNGLHPGGQGIMGVQHFERGLMWAETFQSGHMQPQYQPRATYRYMQWLLGHTDSL